MIVEAGCAVPRAWASVGRCPRHRVFVSSASRQQWAQHEQARLQSFAHTSHRLSVVEQCLGDKCRDLLSTAWIVESEHESSDYAIC